MHIWRSPIRVTRSKLENAILDPVSALQPCPHRRSASDPRDFLSFMREKLSGDNKFYDGGGGTGAENPGRSEPETV